MYVAYLVATDPASKPGQPKPGKLPAGEDVDQAEQELEAALKALPAASGPEITAQNGAAILIRGDSPLPQADAVVSALHAYFRAVKGDRTTPLLALTGYIVDQAGVTPIGTPA